MQAADFRRELKFVRDNHLQFFRTMLILIAKNVMHLLIISAQIWQFALTCNRA